ncbi:DUF6896 domain-containing protein [Micromonospora profundi]|uniref:DUF6896 domain-containing protein n=1 Tax=Micromonospora profundi TaxID=1420889 RepID=UPI00382F477B
MSGSTYWRTQIVDFLEALSALRAALLQSGPDLENLGQLVAEARKGGIQRSGVLGGVEYQVHGRGVLMVDAVGREVDVDLLPDDSAVFDPWRLLRFSNQSQGAGSEVGHCAEQVCRELVREGVLREPIPGWFCAANEPVPRRSRP